MGNLFYNTFCKSAPTVAGPCLRKNTSWLVELPSNMATRRRRNAAAPCFAVNYKYSTCIPNNVHTLHVHTLHDTCTCSIYPPHVQIHVHTLHNTCTCSIYPPHVHVIMYIYM